MLSYPPNYEHENLPAQYIVDGDTAGSHSDNRSRLPRSPACPTHRQPPEATTQSHYRSRQRFRHSSTFTTQPTEPGDPTSTISYTPWHNSRAPESLQLDLLRQIANSYNGSDSIQLLVLRETATHPESPDRLETEAFIRLLIINSQAHYLSDQQRDKNISAIIQRLTNDAPDDRLELLELYYSLCIYLSQMSRGEVLGAYMARAEKIILDRQWVSNAIPNMYYTHAGIIYTEAELYARAVQSDKKLRFF